MQTQLLQIDGLAGPVVVETTKRGDSSITVGGRPATHVKRNSYLLPAADGTMVAAKLSSGMFDAYPSLEVAGTKHRTGPAVPAVLQGLAVLPFGLLLVGGLIGGLIGGSGMAVNMRIARSDESVAAKTMKMLGVLAAATAATFLISALFVGAVSD